MSDTDNTNLAQASMNILHEDESNKVNEDDEIAKGE